MPHATPVRVAVVGCGAVSEILYAEALSSLVKEGVVRTEAFVDPSPERTSKMGKLFPLARCFQDLERMLAETAPDLAIIATPHRLHASLTVSCLEKGVHVLCEKPMAITTADCDRMIEVAHRAGRVLAVGHFRRFFSSCKVIKDVLDAGVLGAVRSFRFLEGETYSWPAQSASFFRRSESGGGVLIDAGAHTMDLFLWWLGDVKEVHYQDDAMGGIEANCRIHLKLANGAQGTVQLSQDSPLPNHYLINCEKGWISYRYDVVNRVEWGLHESPFGLNAEILTLATRTVAGMPAFGSAVPGFLDCFTAQLRNVVAAIHGTEPLRVSGKDARRTVALIEKCYRSRTPLEMPWLDDVEMQRARELAYG